jgi:nitroreductase
MQVSQALSQRKSVRAFLDMPVKHELIEQILNYARYAPSGTNTQPWQVVVVSGATKAQLDQKLLDAFQTKQPKALDYNYYPTGEFPASLQARRLACGLQMYSTLGISREDKQRRLEQWALNYSAFGAPTALYFFIDRSLEKGSYMDAGMFIQSVMLMAVELGLATCAQAALAEYPQIVKHQLGYSDDLILLCGMAIGYEDKNALVNSYRTPRAELSEFTNFFD